MGRLVRSAPLETRTSRLKLVTRGEPYFVSLGGGLHLGYRKRTSGGVWVARRRGEDKRYREERIAKADDYVDADGANYLSFAEAQRAAQAWALVRRDAEVGGVTVSSRYTVADVMREYLEDYKVRGKAYGPTSHVVESKILPELGKTLLSKLTSTQIRNWHNAVASAPSLYRGGKVRAADPNENERMRKRRATANRSLTVLKAALNFAYRSDRIVSNSGWAKVSPFRGVDAPRVRFLSEAEVAKLLKGAAPDFRNLLQGALLTGCRYGELTRLRCGDVNVADKSVAVTETKSGKPRHVYLTEEGAKFFGAMIAKRVRDVHVFQREIGRPWGTSEQARPMKLACAKAKISPVVGFHILRHTHGSWLARNGVSLQVIAAQLGHADIRMTEKHYAHLLPSHVSAAIRANLPKLGIRTTSPQRGNKKQGPNRSASSSGGVSGHD
ncbi:MAG: site-specific integrase [Micropepsaceae bacterium]